MTERRVLSIDRVARSGAVAKLALATALSCVNLSLCVPAAAEETPADAKTHFQRGLELVDAGHFEDASIEFERAYDLNPVPAVLYNVGMAYAAARRPALALEAFSRYLQSDQTVSPKRRAGLESQMETLRRQLASVAVTLEPESAELEVDGRRVESKSILVDAGSHSFRAHAAGYREALRMVTAESGQRLSLELRLEQLPAAPVLASCPTAAARPDRTCAAAQRAIASLESTARRDAERNETRRIGLAVSTAAGALVLAGVASALFFDNRARYKDWRAEQDALDELWLTSKAGAEPTERQAANDARADRIKTQDQVVVGVGVAGGASLIVAALAWFWPGKQEPRGVHAAFQPRLGGAVAGLSW